MSGALEGLRQAVVAQLSQGGLDAVAAMEPEGRRRWAGPVAAVGLDSVTCAPGEILLAGGAGGLDVLELSAQATEFLSQDGRYRLPVRCRCAGWLVARRDSAGVFTDFEVKGRLA